MQNNEDLSFSLNSNHILNSNIEQASPSVFHNYDYHAQNTRPKLQKSNPNPKKSKAGKLSKTMQNRYFSEDDDKENNTSYFNSTPHEEIKPGPYVEKNTEVTQFNLEEPSIKLQNGTELFLDEDGLLTPKSPSSPKESKIDISQYIQEGEESHVEALKKREDLIRNIEKTPDYRNCSEMDLTSADVSDLFEAGELSKRNVYKHQEKVKIVEKPEYSQSPQQPYFNQKMENSSNDKKEKLNPPNESGNINLNPNENLLKSFSIKISTSNLAETHKNIMGSLDYSKSNIEESKNFIGKSSQLFFEPNPEVEKIKSALLNMEELQKIRNEALSEITKKKEKENTDFLVKEFLKNNQPKTVESVHESRENSAGKDLDNDSLLNGRASFGTFNNKENSQKKSGNEFTPRISQEGQGGRNFEERIGTQLKKKFSEGYKQSEEIDFTKTPNTSHLSVYSDKTNGGGGVFTQTSDSKNFNILSKDPFLDFNSPPNLRITNKNFIDTEERQTAKFEKFQRENSGMNRIVEESEDSSVVGEIGKEQNKHHLVSFNQSQMPSPDKSIERKIDQEEEKLGEEKSLDEEEVTPSPGKQEKSEKKIKGINEKIYTEFGTQTFDTCFEEKETSQKKQQQQQEINTSQRRLPPKIRHNIQSDKTLIFHSHEEQIESLKALVSNKPQNQQRSSQKSNASQKSFMQNSFSNQNYSISTNINQHYSSQNSTSPYFGTPNNQIMQMNNYRLSSKSHNSACNSNSDRKSIGLPANKFSQGKNNFFNRLNNMSVYNASYQSNMLNSTLNSSMMHNLNFNSNRALSKIFTNYNNNEVDFYSSFDRRGSSSISLMPRHLKNIGPDCFENSKFTYLAKECYLYSFMSSRLNQSGLEMIQIGIKVIFFLNFLLFLTFFIRIMKRLLMARLKI